MAFQDFIREKKAEKMRIREEKREARRKKEEERKRNREDERVRRQKEQKAATSSGSATVQQVRQEILLLFLNCSSWPYHCQGAALQRLSQHSKKQGYNFDPKIPVYVDVRHGRILHL